MYFIYDIDTKILHHMVTQLLSIIKTPGDNEDKLGEIFNKWITREETMT